MAATYTTETKVRKPYGNLRHHGFTDGHYYRIYQSREAELDKWYMQDGEDRSNLIFGANTTSETSEIRDYERGSFFMLTKYPFINSITSLTSLLETLLTI